LVPKPQCNEEAPPTGKAGNERAKNGRGVRSKQNRSGRATSEIIDEKKGGEGEKKVCKLGQKKRTVDVMTKKGGQKRSEPREKKFAWGEPSDGGNRGGVGKGAAKKKLFKKNWPGAKGTECAGPQGKKKN